MTTPPPPTTSPALRIVARAVGLGLASGVGAGALLGWGILLFHPVGLLFGGVAGIPYGLVGGLAVGLAVTWATRSSKTRPRTAAALAATTPSLIALVILLSSTMDAGEWIPFLVVIPAVGGATLASLQVAVIAGVPREERLRRSQRGLPPGPLAGPWEGDDPAP